MGMMERATNGLDRLFGDDGIVIQIILDIIHLSFEFHWSVYDEHD